MRSLLFMLCLTPLSTTQATAQREPETIMGVGMVKPPISGTQPLYFYGEPSNDPFAEAQAPTDSLTFAEAQYYIDVATAPPWFQPEVLKLDYDLLFMRAVTLRARWVEIIVNTTTGQTAWVDRGAVEYADWSSFLLDVFAVEAIDRTSNPVRVRPFDDSDPVRQSAEALYPLAIRGSWMQVMLDMDGKTTGWIKWRDGDRLLVNYSLLS